MADEMRREKLWGCGIAFFLLDFKVRLLNVAFKGLMCKKITRIITSLASSIKYTGKKCLYY